MFVSHVTYCMLSGNLDGQGEVRWVDSEEESSKKDNIISFPFDVHTITVALRAESFLLCCVFSRSFPSLSRSNHIFHFIEAPLSSLSRM